jgi:hypothetical protein
MSRSRLAAQEGATDTAGRKDTGGKSAPSQIRITVIVQDRYTLDAEVVTGRQIKETANIPEGFDLYRRVQGGNEPVPDDALVELRNGDHFFARPPRTSHDRQDLRTCGGDSQHNLRQAMTLQRIRSTRPASAATRQPQQR